MNHGHLACAGASEGAHAYLVLEGNIEGSQRPCVGSSFFHLGDMSDSITVPYCIHIYSVDLLSPFSTCLVTFVLILSHFHSIWELTGTWLALYLLDVVAVSEMLLVLLVWIKGNPDANDTCTKMWTSQ